MTYIQRPFPPDFPGAVVIPAHKNNVIDRSNNAKAFFVHTPEEPVDDFESTPYYFARDLSPRRASTTFYQDSDGDVYQMVPANIGAIANGWNPGDPPRFSFPIWATRGVSLNLQSESVEVEGYAAAMHRTCPRGGRQWNGLVKLIEHRTRVKGIPLSRVHVVRHDEVSYTRTDPGTLDVDILVADVLALRRDYTVTNDADLQLHELLNGFAGTFAEAAGYMLRKEKMPTGLLARLQAILGLARTG